MKIIDADKTYMFPDVEHMKKWFDEFNARFFANELPPIELRVGWAGKHILGCFHDPSDLFPTGFYPEKCCITLNNWFFRPEDKWRNTMVHEMVHYYVYMKYGKTSQGHGKEFKAEAKRINKISEFDIQTRTPGLSFRPKPGITNRWGENFDEEVILGCYRQTFTEDFDTEEEDIGIIQIERTSKVFSFRTKRRYIPEIIDNMRNVRGSIDWFLVDEGCQGLFLLPVTTAVPSFKPEDIFNHSIIDADDLLDDFGPAKLIQIGTTEFREDGVQGYNPGNRKDDFRQKYFRDAEEIGKLAAEILVRQYRDHSRWFTSTIHGTHNIKPSSGEYTIQVDSRFNPLLAMTQKRILVNPVRSETMMEALRGGDTEKLASEITRVILSRRQN